MNEQELLKHAGTFCKPYRVSDGKKFYLKAIDPGETRGFDDKNRSRAKEILHAGVEVLSKLQEVLYASDQWAVLLIFQAMDSAGKDGAIKHVMSGVNPQGCEVHSFKSPTSEELDHDYLWRCAKRLPERGRIGIFNRSYYEEVLAVRVHSEILGAQKIPRALLTKDIWNQRCEDIRFFERYLTRNGTAVCKFYLHLSKAEQKNRFLDRLNDPDKNWKFSAADLTERSYWKKYMHAYEEMIRHTASAEAPWYVVPANHKWFTRLVVAAAVIDTIIRLDLRFPKVSGQKRRELLEAKKRLLGED